MAGMAFPLTEQSRADHRGALNQSPSGNAAGKETTLSDVLTTLRKRRLVVIGLFLAGLLYGEYKAHSRVKVYVAQGRIEIRSGASNEYRLGGGEMGGALQTQVVILKSDTLLFNVALDLDLANNPEFLGTKTRPNPRVDYTNASVREGIVAQLNGVLNIMPVNKTDLVVITATTLNPKLSADIVNKLVEEYIRRSFESHVGATNRATNFLMKQLDDLKQQVESSQTQMLNLQKKIGIVALDPGKSQTASSIETLTTAADNAEIDRIMAESRYRVLAGMDRDALDQTVANAGQNVAASHLTALRADRDSAVSALAELTNKRGLGPNHPQVIAANAHIAELSQQIQEEQTRVLAQAKQTMVAMQANETNTRAALEAEKEAADRMEDDLNAYHIRESEYTSGRTLYEGLLERLRTASVQAGLESTDIEIIDQAMTPAAPSLPSRSSLLLLNALAGAVIGVILAFILESLDTGLRSIADIETVSGLPSLALIPRSRRAGVDVSELSIAQRNLGSLSSPKSQFTEAFRSLRTSLLLSTAGSSPRVILLTSATPSEGKTTVSTNLACVMAQNNARVLLIDGDLRRPTIHHRLGLNGKVGLTSVLTGTTKLEDAVQRLAEAPTLDILVSGPVPPFPTEMLGSQTMVDMLEYAKTIYTHIIIDSPPLLSVTDGVVLASMSDAVVLIVRHGRSGKNTVRRARELLMRTRATVTGVAINAVDLSSPEYYGYYGYSTYAGYGSSNAETSGWVPKKPRKGDAE